MDTTNDIKNDTAKDIAHETRDKPVAAPPPRPDGNLLRGAIYAGLCFFLFVIMNMAAKILDGRFHVIELAFYRNMLGVLVIGGWMALRERRLFALKSGRIIIVRALIGLLSLAITFAAFQHLPMANAQTLLFTSSLIIPVMAFFALGERVGPWRMAAIAAGFGGVCLIAGPSAQASAIGVALALAAALCHAFIGVMLRHLGRSDAPLTITFYFVLIGFVLSGAAMPFIATVPQPGTLLPLAALALSGTFAQLMLAYAYRDLQASLMAILSYTSLFWAVALDWLVWRQVPTLPMIAGALVIIASNLVILWRENRQAAHRLRIAGASHGQDGRIATIAGKAQP